MELSYGGKIRGSFKKKSFQIERLNLMSYGATGLRRQNKRELKKDQSFQIKRQRVKNFGATELSFEMDILDIIKLRK